MSMHRQGVLSANWLEGVEAWGRWPAGKRWREAAPMYASRVAIAALIAVTAAGCEKVAPPASEARPVRAITIEHGAEGEIVSLTGHIRPKDEVSLAFRLDGRMIERPVHIGDVLKPGQVVARLDPQIQDNTLRSAEANLASAEAVLTQARLTFGRQQQLLKDGWTTRANFDEVQQKLLSAEAQVDSAQAQVRTAREQQSYTVLSADSPGAVTATGAEFGRSGPRRADDRAARASGRTRRRIRRPRATHPESPAAGPGRHRPHQRPTGEGDRPGAGDFTPGGCRDADISGEGWDHRSAAGDEAGRHCHRAHPTDRAARRRGAGERPH